MGIAAEPYAHRSSLLLLLSHLKHNKGLFFSLFELHKKYAQRWTSTSAQPHARAETLQHKYQPTYSNGPHTLLLLLMHYPVTSLWGAVFSSRQGRWIGPKERCRCTYHARARWSAHHNYNPAHLCNLTGQIILSLSLLRLPGLASSLTLSRHLIAACCSNLSWDWGEFTHRQSREKIIWFEVWFSLSLWLNCRLPIYLPLSLSPPFFPLHHDICNYRSLNGNIRNARAIVWELVKCLSQNIDNETERKKIQYFISFHFWRWSNLN